MAGFFPDAAHAMRHCVAYPEAVRTDRTTRLYMIHLITKDLTSANQFVSELEAAGFDDLVAEITQEIAEARKALDGLTALDTEHLKAVASGEVWT